MSKTTWGIGAAIIIVVGAGVWYADFYKKTEVPVAHVVFECDAGKTIDATFYKSDVSLVLSDGRKMSLPQTVSASGARYANQDESLVFWNKGNTAFVTEGGATGVQTYSNCAAPDASGRIIVTYASSSLGFSLQYPKEYTLNESYTYDQFGPKKLIHGIKLVVPASMATGTNLSSFDTGISVEELPHALHCTGDIFLSANVRATSINDNGTDYSVASTSGAGAGNFYEEVVYALLGSKPCTAVRYMVHSGNIDNYPKGAVQEFNRAALMADFDQIRHSLTLTR